MKKSSSPQLHLLITEVENRLKDFVSQEDIIQFASSWYTKYNCEIDCSEELKENLYINVTFDNAYSVGSYVSLNNSINKALDYIEKGFEEFKSKRAKRMQEDEKRVKEQQALQLIKEGKVSEAAELLK